MPRTSQYVMETLHLAAALSLLAPLISAPGGSFVTFGALLLLASSRFEIGAVRIGYWVAAWLVAALLIGLTRMESLWLPWLIACPAFTSFRASSSLSGCVLLLGTIPLVAMQNLAHWFILFAAAAELWRWKQPSTHSSDDTRSFGAKSQPSLAWSCAVAFALLMPFAASPLNGLFTPRSAPPAAAMPRDLGANAYRVRVVGQPPDLELDWYEPSGEGRHHTLDVCMQYRGVTLRPASIADVKTDGRRWMREFFLQRGGLVLNYGEYLRRTSLPLSSAGVHLIASSPVEAMSAAAFAESSGESARELCHMLERARIAESRTAADRPRLHSEHSAL